MKVNLYKHLSDAKEVIEVEAGTYLYEAFPELEWENVKVFVNGVIKDKYHRVDYGDMIAIRWIPKGVTTSVLLGLGLLVSIIVGVYAGVQAYKANKMAEKAKKEMEKLQSQTRDDITNLPWLKGAQNTLSTGKTQPYIIGKHLFTPYILNSAGKSSKGYSTICGSNGEKQFYNVVLEAGYNKQVLDSINVDNVTIRNFGGLTPQEFPDANGKSNLAFNSDSVFASDDSFIEIAQDGAGFSSVDGEGRDVFNYKVVEEQKNDEVKKHAKVGEDDSDYQDLYYTLADNSKGLDLCIMFNGLVGYTSEGVKVNSSRTILPYYSLNYADVKAGLKNEEIVWTPITFSKSIWVKPVTTNYTSYYTYTYRKRGNKAEPNGKEWIEKQKANWTLTSGSDIRDTYNSIETKQKSYTESGYLSLTETVFTVAITIKKTVTIPGYYIDNVPTTTFTGNFTKQVRYNTHKDFSFDEIFESTDNGYQKKYSQPITIKISSTDRESSVGTENNSCYVQWIQSHTFDEIESEKAGSFVAEKNIETKDAEKSTLIGLHIESTTANEDKLSSIQIVTNGVARIWDGEDWTSEKSPTSNPAAWLLEILTSNCHTPSQLDENEIDLESLGEWYEFCESKKIEINYVISQGVQKSALIEMICNIGRASLYQNIYGKIAVAIDTEKENAVAILNEQNIISLSWEKDMTRQPDGVTMTYIDAESGYQQNEITVMYDGSDPATRGNDTVIKEIKCDGITHREQAFRYCYYVMKSARLRPKTITAQIGKEGLFFNPLDKVLLQHPSLKVGLGSAEIKSVILNEAQTQIKGFELCEAVELDGTSNFTVIVQCVGSDYCTPKSYNIENFDGRTKEIYLKTPIATTTHIKPKKGDVLSYGYGAYPVTDEMIIKSIAPTDNGYTLTLVDYDTRIFNDIEEIPAYVPQLTDKGLSSGSLPTSLPTPTMAQMAETIQNAVAEIDTSIVESPNIYAEVMSCGFSVNDDGITPIAQKIKTKVHVIQAMKEIDFVFGEFDLPNGFNVEIDYHTLTFTVAAGVRVGTGIINIPVIFRKLIHDNFYGDEDGTLYSDETNEIYGEYNFDTKLTYYNLGFNYDGVKGGKYYGKISNIEDIPSENIVIGDYFTWTGDDTTALKKGGCYAWDGLTWIKDSVRNHLGGTLSDVLSVANANLQENNSEVYQFLDHLTANSIFVDKLVANSAFIENIFTQNIILKNTGSIQSENYETGRSGIKINANGESEFNGAIYAKKGHFYSGIGEAIKLKRGTNYIDLKNELFMILVYDGTCLYYGPNLDITEQKINKIYGAYIVAGFYKSDFHSGQVSIVGNANLIPIYNDTSIASVSLEHIQEESTYDYKDYYRLKIVDNHNVYDIGEPNLFYTKINFLIN